ncbi:hypothetical protein [Pseudomonas shirazensis]|uniref:hypothetical protein n=1 Tax=Pseudomonas shirazensis TaxID=2745494 RepID=UPI001647F7A7|nr:hypothetical protein [Pseudomonas shirazensis]MBV4501035.1 hypothetical protein [Pseudomonas shirazensis]
MYLATRIDKSVLLNAVLLFAYFLALVWVNNSYIYQLYDYMGAAERPLDFVQTMYLLLLAVICALLAVGRIERPGDLLVAFFVLVLVPHALVLNGANRYSPEANPFSGVTLAVVIGLSIIGLANKIRFYPKLDCGSGSQGKNILLILSVLNLAVLAYIVAKSAGYFSLDFSSHYARRAVAREIFAAGTPGAYLASIGTQALFPVLFAWGVYKRKKRFLVLGSLNVLIVWGAFGQKYPVVLMFLIYFIMLYYRKFGSVKLSWLLIALLGVLMLGAIEYEVLGYSYLNDYLLRRAFVVPSTLLGAADAFVIQFGNNYYGDTLLGAVFGQGRSDPVTFRLGVEMFENPEMNANVNFIAVAFMQFKYIGVVVETSLVAGITVLLNFLYSRHGAVLAIPVALLIATKIIEQSLLTVLLGSGVFFMLVSLILISLPLRLGARTSP